MSPGLHYVRIMDQHNMPVLGQLEVYLENVRFELFDSASVRLHGVLRSNTRASSMGDMYNLGELLEYGVIIGNLPTLRRIPSSEPPKGNGDQQGGYQPNHSQPQHIASNTSSTLTYLEASLVLWRMTRHANCAHKMSAFGRDFPLLVKIEKAF